MKLNYSKIAEIIIPVSILVILVGYFLWAIILPVPDFHMLTNAEQLITQKQLAFNYPLGRFSLYAGFTGFITSSVYLIVNALRKQKNR